MHWNSSANLLVDYYSLVFLLISNLISWLCLHQFVGTKNTETEMMQTEPTKKITNEQKDQAYVVVVIQCFKEEEQHKESWELEHIASI